MNAIWYQTVGEKTATITRINDQYTYAIFDLWLDRYGKKVAGPLVKKGDAATLAAAKNLVLQYMIADKLRGMYETDHL